MTRHLELPSAISTTSLRGLLAQQAGLDVTAHNIANAETARLLAPDGALDVGPACSYQRCTGRRRRRPARRRRRRTASRAPATQFADIQFRAQTWPLPATRRPAWPRRPVEGRSPSPATTGLRRCWRSTGTPGRRSPTSRRRRHSRRRCVDRRAADRRHPPRRQPAERGRPDRPQTQLRRHHLRQRRRSSRSRPRSPASTARSARRSPPAASRTTCSTAATGSSTSSRGTAR